MIKTTSGKNIASAAPVSGSVNPFSFLRTAGMRLFPHKTADYSTDTLRRQFE
jgi:hypothetical protein